MTRFSTFAFISGLLTGTTFTLAQTITTAPSGTTATPTGPVVTITFPGGVDDGQAIVGSLIGINNGQTTLAIGCPDGTSPEDCGFDPSPTITFGSTTLAFSVDYDGFTVAESCSFSADGGVCTMTAPSDSETTTDGAAMLTTSTTSLGPSDLQTVGITVTAGSTAALASSGSTSPSTTSAATSRGGAGATAATTTTTHNDARMLVPGAFGAALMGLAAVLL